MLSLFGSHGTTRRELLRIGSLGFGGLALPELLGNRASAAQRRDYVTGKSVIFLFQQGGPSQLETFDPKIDVSSSIATMTGVTQTSIAGIQFGATMEKLAALADQLTVVRSFRTNNGGHNLRPIVGPESLEANVSAHYARVVGATQPRSALPTSMVLHSDSVSEAVPRSKARGNLRATGPHANLYAPFVPGGGGQLQSNMQLNLSSERFEDRSRLFRQLDQIGARIAHDAGWQSVDAMQRQAYELLVSGSVARALDLTLESPDTLARYDTSHLCHPGRWDKVRRGPTYDAQAATLGKLLCLSRRLCEAGCGFITIHAGYDGVWDMHADGNNLNMVDGMEAVGRSFDHAVAAFIEDVRERGMQDNILLVCCGEMGRTPRINRRGGRDHWSRLAPLMLFGGGLPAGQVIGQSTRDAAEPAGSPLDGSHLISTILHTVFDIGKMRLDPSIPPEIMKLAEPSPIHAFA